MSQRARQRTVTDMSERSGIVTLGMQHKHSYAIAIHTVKQACNTHMLTVFEKSSRASEGAGKL